MQNKILDISRNTESITDFTEILNLITKTQRHAYQAVNTLLIDLYWQVGEYISKKIKAAEWGEGIVKQLAEYIARTHPDLRGFTRPNLFRMKQFYEAYQGDIIVSALLRQLSWTHNLIIMAQSKYPEEREFYLTSRWSRFRSGFVIFSPRIKLSCCD